MHPNVRPVSRRRNAPREPTERERLRAWEKFHKTECDWQWTDILRVLDFKLGRVQAAIAGGYGGERKARVAEIKEVRGLLRRAAREHSRYQDELWSPHRKKWGNLRMKFLRTDKGSTVSFVFTKAKSAAETQRAHRAYDRVSVAAERALQSDIKKAFRLLAAGVQTWWE